MNDPRSSFESLYAQYQAMVLQMCLGFVKGDRDLADDLAQETFINMWNALDGFRGDSSPKTWIYRIAVNTCLQHLRKEKARAQVSISTLGNAPLDASPPAAADNELYSAIGQLAEIDRLIITMVLDEVEYPEIARVVGINEGGLRVRIHRIKQRLKKLLEHEHRI